MKSFFCLFLVFISLSSYSSITLECQRSPYCDQLDEKSFECDETKDKSKCDEFVEIFDKLLDKHTCTLKGKKLSLVPITSCPDKKGSAYLDIHYDRLAAMASEKALKLYTSKKFRASLDGHIAEVHKARSLRDEKNLGKSLRPLEYDFISFLKRVNIS